MKLLLTLLAAASATVQTSNTVVVTNHDKDGLGFVEFFIGLVLIPLTLVCLWKNEKKIVDYHKVIVSAKKSVVTADPNNVLKTLDYKLVHV
jgi:hypothetical protein